jgi:hypothetical protein
MAIKVRFGTSLGELLVKQGIPGPPNPDHRLNPGFAAKVGHTGSRPCQLRNESEQHQLSGRDGQFLGQPTVKSLEHQNTADN